MTFSRVLSLGCNSSQTCSTTCSTGRRSPSGMDCFTVVPHGLPNPSRKLVSVWSLLHRRQLLPGACTCVGTKLQLCSGHSHLLQHRACLGLPAVAYLIHCDPRGSGGTTCLTMVCIMGCRGTFALVPGAPPPSASPVSLVSADLFLSCFLTPLSQMLLCSIFHSFLNKLSQRHYLCL